MKAFKLVIKHSWSPREDELYYVGENSECAQRFFEEHWNKLTYLVSIQDITETERGMDLMVRHELEKRGNPV